MKKMLSITMLALAVALSLAFAGCSSAPKDYSANFQGNWKMTSMVGASEEDMAFIEALGMSVILDLKEDKSASLNMMGEEMTGSWEAVSETECTVTFEGDSATGKLNGEELSLAVEGEEMVFKKVSEDEAAAIKENAASMEDALGADSEDSASDDSGVTYDDSFIPVTVADDDQWTINVVAKKTDEWGDAGYALDITNKLDIPIYVTVPFDKCTVNGKMVDFWGGKLVLPGKSAEDVFFYASADDVPSISEMTNVEMAIEVWNNDTYETLGSYNVALN